MVDAEAVCDPLGLCVTVTEALVLADPEPLGVALWVALALGLGVTLCEVLCEKLPDGDGCWVGDMDGVPLALPVIDGV